MKRKRLYGQEYYEIAPLVILGAVAVGAAVGAGTGAATGGVSAHLQGKDWKEGATRGAIEGGVFGAVTGPFGIAGNAGRGAVAVATAANAGRTATQTAARQGGAQVVAGATRQATAGAARQAAARPAPVFNVTPGANGQLQFARQVAGQPAPAGTNALRFGRGPNTGEFLISPSGSVAGNRIYGGLQQAARNNQQVQLVGRNRAGGGFTVNPVNGQPGRGKVYNVVKNPNGSGYILRPTTAQQAQQAQQAGRFAGARQALNNGGQAIGNAASRAGNGVRNAWTGTNKALPAVVGATAGSFAAGRVENNPFQQQVTNDGSFVPGADDVIIDDDGHIIDGGSGGAGDDDFAIERGGGRRPAANNAGGGHGVNGSGSNGGGNGVDESGGVVPVHGGGNRGTHDPTQPTGAEIGRQIGFDPTGSATNGAYKGFIDTAGGTFFEMSKYDPTKAKQLSDGFHNWLRGEGNKYNKSIFDTPIGNTDGSWRRQTGKAKPTPQEVATAAQEHAEVTTLLAMARYLQTKGNFSPDQVEFFTGVNVTSDVYIRYIRDLEGGRAA